MRLYISTVIACPYEGMVSPSSTLQIMDKLLPLGFAQISLGDTIGVGKPADWGILLKEMNPKTIKENKLAMHCHDTYGTALACVETGLAAGIRTFDSSMGGLGGCPFAPGAKGNLATEDLVAFLEKKGIDTGIPLESLKGFFDPSRTGPLKNRSQFSSP